MIIGCLNPLAVGQRHVKTVSDSEGVKHQRQPFVVLREATAEEWMAADPDNRARWQLLLPDAHFYEISVD